MVIFREGERFYAIDELGTHVGTSHMKSRVKEGVLECRLHKGHFCLESGDPVKYPAR
ncbi:MAG: Rieske 2Fe-2S domain-containing protein [Corynebacterium sp.]|nr:Rieske 2Fe-2S domain-containing protein [Corynebacterium sp.]